MCSANHKLSWIFVFLMSGLYAASAFAASPEMSLSQESCISLASSRYGVPELLIKAIIRTEGGVTGRTSARNVNGTYDLGLMQINEMHLRQPPHNLQRMGITRDVLINNECINIMVGTYILSVELSKPGEYWWNVGSYNSRTPCEKFRGKKRCPNEVYRAKVLANVIELLRGRG